jgi:tungstate transport system substrate-binding protein
MNTITKIIAVVLIAIVAASVGAYAYIQTSQAPTAQPTPSPTQPPSQTPATTLTPNPSQLPTSSPLATETTTPTNAPTPVQSSSPNPITSPTPTSTIAPTFTPTPTITPTPTTTPVSGRLIISSTTSLYETGFLDAVQTAFAAKYPSITVSFLSQGTGIAIQTAMRGDADMIMVHDPVQETTFLANGYGVNRKIIAYNFFVIVGPANDPANITGMAPLDALKQIKALGEQGNAVWVSRDDNSGTNSKEKALWKAANIDWNTIKTQPWYLRTGTGMTPTLQVTNEKNGYTLTDLGSYLNNFKQGNIQLKIVVQATKDLLNVYSVIADNPQNSNLTQTNFAAEMLFIQYMTSDEGQQMLANYGKATVGQSLFYPYVPLVTSGSNDTLLGWIQNYAFINGTECPPAYRYNAGNLYGTPLPSVAPPTIVNSTFAAVAIPEALGAKPPVQ